MSSELLIAIVLSYIAIFYIYKQVLDRKYKQKQKIDKDYMSSILSLNISHLHDAANFFALLKNDIKDGKQGPQNFAKGAAYHFRSLFEELKGSQELFDKSDLEDLADSKLALLYKKESVDLKDLLSLELFQVSSYTDGSDSGRLSISDESNSEHALVYGNFGLLSKAILNLVENALKYTDKPIRVELKDIENKWQLKISSYGKSIPEALAKEINNAQDPSSTGHGLTSLMDIMNFHNADLKIDTLAEEGTCIRLVFDKYSSLGQASIKTKPSHFKSIKGIDPRLVYTLTLVTMVLGFTLLISHNRGICEDYYVSITSMIESDDTDAVHKERLCQEYLHDLNHVLMSKDVSYKIDKLMIKYETVNQRELFNKIYNEFINNFTPEYQRLVALILYKHLLLKAPMHYDKLLDSQARELIVEFPGSVDLNYHMTNYYWGNKKYPRTIIYSIRFLLALIESKLYIHPELYLNDRLEPDIESMSQFLANLYQGLVETPLVEQEILSQEEGQAKLVNGEELVDSNLNGEELSDDKSIQEEVKPDEEPKQELPLERKALDLDGLIDKQDQDLGFRFEL